MKNVNPITDQEIEEVRVNVRKKTKLKANVKAICYTLSALIFLVVFMFCMIVQLKWHTFTVFGSVILINLATSLIIRKYAN